MVGPRAYTTPDAASTRRGSSPAAQARRRGIRSCARVSGAVRRSMRDALQRVAELEALRLVPLAGVREPVGADGDLHLGVIRAGDDGLRVAVEVEHEGGLRVPGRHDG